MRYSLILGLIGAIAAAASVNAQDARSYTVNFTNTPPVIDGVIEDLWDGAAGGGDQWTELQRNGDVDLDNNRFRMFWDQNFLYMAGETDMEDFGPPNDAVNTDFNTEASVNIYFDPDTDGTGPVSPPGEVDGYQVAFSLREGFAELKDGIRTFGNGVDGHQMALFMEAHVNNKFGDQAEWVDVANPDDFELGDRFPDLSIAHVNVNGTPDEVGSGAFEAAFPWTMFNANGTEDAGNLGIGEQEGIFHPMAPQSGDEWIFSAGMVSGKGGGLFVLSDLPIWADGGPNFAAREEAPGHGVLTFAGGPPTGPGTVLGVGTDALLGNDLTDEGNDGDETAYTIDPFNPAGFDAEFSSSDEPGFGGGEFAFNVFDNLLGPGSDKWCCGTAFPQIVGADLGRQVELTHFTVSSANDVDARDPRVWSIEGSNDGDNWTTIFSQDNPDASLWDERLQVIRFDAGTDFDAPAETYSQFRMVTDATGATEGAFFQLGEIEFFGNVGQVCGDFDMDGDVDSADRTTQTTNWTGALPPGDPNATKTFPEGDCDADGDIDTADQNGLINNWTGAMNAGNAGPDTDAADLIYDPATGNVTLDATQTASQQFISFVLGAADGMRPENFVESAPGNAGPFIDVGTNTDAKTFQIGQTDPLNQGAGPVIDLGDVFPAGIASKEALAEYLTLAEYASELGSGGTFDLMVIPEPSSLALALIGMLGLISRRRRK